MVSAFVLFLLVIGAFVYSKISSQLYSYMEKQAESQISAAAETMNMRMELEFNELELLAQYHESDREVFLEHLDHKSDANAFEIGLLAIDGTALYGEVLDFGAFKGIYDSFHGNRAVSFSVDKGLLFTLPIYRGKNIRYVIYKLYDTSVLGEGFATGIYNGSGRISVVDGEGNIVIPVEAQNTDLLESMMVCIW